MKYLSDPSTVRPVGTANLRKPRLAALRPGKLPKVQKPKVKLMSVAALAGPKLSAPKTPPVPKVKA